MSRKIIPIILAGGLGTRLWPISRTARPKQFLALTSASSLFQETLKRVSDPSIYRCPIVITNEEYRFLVAEQALEAGVRLDTILLEPAVRNTAPAITAAAAYAARNYGNDVVLHVLPSDHAVIADEGYFASIGLAAAVTCQGRHTTFGIVPTLPETGFGYIELGEPIFGEARSVKRFLEKPDREKAVELVNSGDFLWNSGMFMLQPGTFLAECAQFASEVYAAATTALDRATPDLDFTRLDSASFAGSPNISVDYAIFERTTKAAVVPVRFGWSDLGSWDAVWKIGDKDAAENVTRGAVTISNTTRSLVVSEKTHVAIEGLDDVAVIASEDAIFVGKLSEAQKVGAIVKLLNAASNTAPLTAIHRTTYRPWGGYSSVLNGERFQVKRLFVKPGKKISLQKHHHRSEHWVVVRGTAEVTIDGKVTTLTENQSVYLPQGCIHRLFNPGKIELELIEVQTGSYLGEDDIIRIEDDFGRK